MLFAIAIRDCGGIVASLAPLLLPDRSDDGTEKLPYPAFSFPPHGGDEIKPSRQTPVSSQNLSLSPTPPSPPPLMASATFAPLAQRMMGTRGLMVIPISLRFGGTVAVQTSLCDWKTLLPNGTFQQRRFFHLFFCHRLQCYSML